MSSTTYVQAPDQAPPQDLSAEQAVLGAAMLSPLACQTVTEGLVPADFYREAHRLIYEAILETVRSNDPVDIITVASALRRKSLLEATGGGEYLTALLNELPTTAHAPRYVNIVKQASVLRQTIMLSSELSRAAYEHPADAADLIGPRIAALETLQELAAADTRPMSAADVCGDATGIIQARMQRDYEVSTARFGIPDMDRLTGGLEDAGYTILKGGTGAGKTSFMLQAALSTAEQIEYRSGQRVLYFGMEESAWRLQMRCMAWLGQFNSRALKNRYVWEDACRKDPDLDRRFWEANGQFSGLPLFIISGRRSMGDIEAYCRRIRRDYEPVLICVDYLQKIIKPDGMEREEQAYREVTDRFVRLREQVKCPIIGASQVTAGANGEEHTFGARFFEFDADTVLSIRRKKDPETESWPPHASIVMQKARELDGFGRFPAYTDFPTGRWYSMAEVERWNTEERQRRYADGD